MMRAPRPLLWRFHIWIALALVIAGAIPGSAMAVAVRQDGANDPPPIAAPDLLRGRDWDCVNRAREQDGAVTVTAGNSFNTVVNGALLFRVEPDFRVVATIDSEAPSFAGVTLYGVPPAPNREWWRGIKRLDVGLAMGQARLVAYDGSSPNPILARNFPLQSTSRPAELALSKVASQLVLASGDAVIGAVEDPELFASGRLLLGANVAPSNRLLIYRLAVEAITDLGPIALAPDALSLAVTPAESGDSTLRSLAASRGVLIGASLKPERIRNDAQYRELVARQYTVVTPENALKFGPVHPDPDRYAFCSADTIMRFADANGLKVRGHTLVWHMQLPRWITERTYSREELLTILREHVLTVVGRYKGRIGYWDVVNEALNEDGSLRDTPWLRGIGPDYLELAFRWANEADPGALLFYNEYSAEGLGRKSDAVLRLVTDLKNRGVPIHGVGLQAHFTLNAPSAEELSTNMRRLAAAGLQVHVTEIDVRLRRPANTDDLAAQARIYRRTMETCVAEAACTAFVGWNVYDGDSWIPNFFPGFGAATPFDEDFRPKPAYDALAAALRGQ